MALWPRRSERKLSSARPKEDPLDFEFAHAFAHPPTEVAATLLDEEFQRALTEIEGIEKRELLSQEERADGTVFRRTRCVLGIDLGSVGRRMIGDAEPAWVEEALWNPDRSTWSWEVIPEVGKQLLEAGGDIVIESDGGGTVRRVVGRLSLKVPIYGARIEPSIVRGLERAYEEEAERLAEWLEREKA